MALYPRGTSRRAVALRTLITAGRKKVYLAIVGRWRCCWPPGRALELSESRCSCSNAAVDTPHDASIFCCGRQRRGLRAASRQLRWRLPRSCLAHFLCSLTEGATLQQRLERPAGGIKIATKCDRTPGSTARHTFPLAAAALAAAAICSRFLLYRAFRRSLTPSKELPACVSSRMTSSACCCGRFAACRLRMWL